MLRISDYIYVRFRALGMCRDICILLVFLPFGLSSQNEAASQLSVDRVLKTLKSDFQSHLYYEENAKENQNTEEVIGLFKVNDTLKIAKEIQFDLNIEKSDRLRNNFGVNAYGNFLSYNVGQVDEDFISYRYRYYLGVDWDLLKQGWVANRYKAKLYDIINKEQAVTLKYERKKLAYNKAYFQLVNCFQFEKEKILKRRKTIITGLNEEAIKLLMLKYITKEDLLKSQIKSAKIEGLIDLNNVSRQQIKQFSPITITNTHLPFIDINISNVLENSRMHSLDSINKWAEEKVKIKNNPYQNIKLNPYLRYNYYDFTNSNLNSFMSYGFGVSAPVNFKWNQKKINELEINLIKAKNREQADLILKEIYVHFDRFRYHQKAFLDYKEREGIIREKLRKELSKLNLGLVDFHPYNANLLLDNLLDLRLKSANELEKVYIEALNLYTLMDKGNPNEIIFPVLQKEHAHQFFTPNGIYIWSSSFKKNTVAFLKEYIAYNDFTNVILSRGIDSISKVKSKALIKDLSSKNFAIELMIGSNKLTGTNVAGVIKNAVGSLDKALLTSIHLDFEPHVFPDFKVNRDKYLKAYVDVVTKAKSFCKTNGWRLTVSIPNFYPEGYLRQIYKEVDLVYLMCYENVKFDFIKRKIAEEQKISKNKTCLALSAKDFSNRIELEALAKRIKLELGVKNIVVHDLDKLQKLDQVLIK